MRKLLLIQIITLFSFNYLPAFAYIYHCPSTIPDYSHSGDQEMWLKVIKNDPSVIGKFTFIGAYYNYNTGEGNCYYQCKGCDSQGYCACNKPGSLIITGELVEPVTNDNTKWKPNLGSNTITCSMFNNEACPWKLKVSSL